MSIRKHPHDEQVSPDLLDPEDARRSSGWTAARHGSRFARVDAARS